MRRFTRPLIIAMVALGLAVGAGVGLAAPAAADSTGFFGAITSPVTDASDLVFAGMKEAGSTFSSMTINNDDNTFAIYSATDPTDVEGSLVCDGLAATSTSWNCDWTPPIEDGLEAGEGPAESFLTLSQQDSDGTTSTDVLAFDVFASGDEGANVTPYPVQDFQFTAGGMSETTAPSENDGYVGTYVRGNDTETEIDCPSGINEDGDNSADEVSDTQGAVPCDTSLDSDEWFVDAVEGLPRDGNVAITGTSYSLFYVPAPPTVTSAVLNANNSITVTGAGGIADQAVDILRDADATQNLCHVQLARSQAWTCTTAVLPAGTYALSAVNEDVDEELKDAEDYQDAYIPGGLSAATAAAPVIVTAATTPGGTTGGSVGDITPNWSFTVSGDLNDLHPGDTITITGSGLPAGTSLDTILHSVPTDLGTVVAAADGTFTQTVTIPDGVDIGAHTIQVTASGPGIVTTTKQQAITVTAPPAASSGSSGKSGVVAPAPAASHGDGGNASGTGIAPNILTRALTPFADVAIHPNKIVSAFEIGLVLLLLAVLPAHLLNATIAEQSDRFERRFRKIHTPGWLFRLGIWFRSTPVAGGIIVTLATAILFGFADPTFGFTLASLRLILACGIALFLVGYVANAITGAVARIQWNIVAAVSTRPYGLILTIVGVLISRLLHFSPGFLIGLILGLTIQGKSAAGFAWRTVVLRSSIVLAMAIAAWIGYSTLTLGGNEGGTFGSALLVETLVAITTEGVVALLVELLPLRFLEGERVYAHSRILWGIFYVLTLVVFVLAVVPWEGNWDALGSSLWVWIGVLAIFAAVCVGIYIYFRRFAPPLEEEAGNENVAIGETVAGDNS